MESTAVASHRWKFFRAGGVDQVQLRGGADIENLSKLDQKLWIALACPVKGIDFDAKTLAILDLDKDGRVRAQEVLACIDWLKARLKGLDHVMRGDATVQLAAIDEKTREGAALLAGAKRILHDLGKPAATAITLADLASTERIFAQTKFNGDGIVPADSAADPATRQAIEDVIAALGSVQDRSGKPGIDQAKVDAFFAQAKALVEWSAKPAADRSLLPLGEATEPAAAAVAAVESKVVDYFTRCRIAAFDPRAAAALDATQATLAAVAPRDLDDRCADLAKLPLARIEAGKPLPLAEGVNPILARAVEQFAEAAAMPLLGSRKASLTDAEWAAIVGKLAPYRAWIAAKPATAVEKLGLDRLRELVASDAKAKIDGLIQQDKALEVEVAQIADVERLLLLQRDLVKFLNNFVNFSDFYARKGATFQAGTLYLDARSCNLCVRVDDAGKHAALAGLAKSFLVYCDCVRPAQNEKMTIAAAFTDGDADDIMVGRNGLFYDRKGNDWDATITKVIENPISIRQAFWGPYKRFVRMVEEQAAKRASAADAAAHDKLGAAATATVNADLTKPTEPAPPPDKKIDVGTVAALGVAVAGVATFLSTILAAFFGLGRWMPLGFVGIMAAISGPSMIVAWLKLRQRNLGPILDASGWAVNGRVKINVPFGRALTELPRLPRGSEWSVRDPYAEKKRPWGLYITLVVVVALAVLWFLGKLDHYVPVSITPAKVLPDWAIVSSATAPEVKKP
ncbi:MAG TPA: hypothetical protein VFF73_33270 [Planctomycetota bacterium]|nr:hypothetical protein [Planctomycetota bacterium]